MTREAKNPVRTTMRSFDVLETLRNLDGARLTKVADHLDLPNSTVHSHLSTLSERGYVVKEGDIYQVSLRFLDFGEWARRRHRVYEIARPEVDELAATTGEMANLLVEQNGYGVYLYEAYNETAVPLDSRPGKHVSLHVTAVGKAILAHLSDRRVAEIIDEHGLEKLTPNTITDREVLRDNLEAIRERGYAVDDEERISGTRCVATPLKTEDGTVVAAVSVSGPTTRLDDGRIEEEVASALEAARNVVELKLAYA